MPAKTGIVGFRQTAVKMGITLMPWQELAARYITAVGPDGRHLYREVCLLAARQQGKTTLMKPHIVRELRAGRKIMHIAQNRELPRQMFGIIADAIAESDEALLPRRRGRIIWPRYGSGQEEIVLNNGATYRIAAASRGSARGWPNDIVIIDELREMDSFEIIAAAEPTLTMSSDPQMIYLSNAGHEGSVVLNSVRDRAGEDESLAYIEWSAAPDRTPDDREGWAEANPALAFNPAVLRTLESSYRKAVLSGNLAMFETEHLCRWVTTTMKPIVDPVEWAACRGPVELPKRPIMAVNMDASGTRASAVIAWSQADGTVGLRVVADVTGEPIDMERLGRDLSNLARTLRVADILYDPFTDQDLARYLRRSRPLNGLQYANACERFARLVNSRRLRWQDAEAVGEQLAWTGRKETGRGSWMAVLSMPDHPVTSVLAAIRACWVASEPRQAAPRIF